MPSSTIKPILSSRPLTTYGPISTGYNSSPSVRTSARKSSYSDLLNMSEKSDDEEESEEPLPTNEEEKEKCMLRFFQQAQKFYAKGVEPRESRLVDFPVFKGGNQDPIEWLEAFCRACEANRINAERAVTLVAFYLKGTALTWYNRQTITAWEDDNNQQRSFTHLFKDHFCNPFRMSQWKHQLRNRKQKQGETVEEYIAAITEL